MSVQPVTNCAPSVITKTGSSRLNIKRITRRVVSNSTKRSCAVKDKSSGLERVIEATNKSVNGGIHDYKKVTSQLKYKNTPVATIDLATPSTRRSSAKTIDLPASVETSFVVESSTCSTSDIFKELSLTLSPSASFTTKKHKKVRDVSNKVIKPRSRQPRIE